jgi:hypothetical protein
MDYRSIRAEFGPRYLLIGGFDTDVLRQDRTAIRNELRQRCCHSSKGWLYPLADGRVQEGISFENYAYYRKLLEELTLC